MLEESGGLSFRLSLLLGVVVRLVIAPFTGYGFDIEVLKFAARTYYEGTEIVLFKNWTNPPLLYYITLFTYSFYFLLHDKLGIPDFYPFAHGTGALEVLFLKLPFILSDILIFLLLRRSLSLLGVDKNESLTLSNLYLLNPYVILISAAHGMWDALASFFLVLGVYFLIKSRVNASQRGIYYATLAFMASFGVKWIGLASLFVLFTLLIARKAYVQVGKVVLTSLASLLLLFLPFLVYGYEYLFQVIAFRVSGGSSPLWGSSHFQLLYFFGVSPSLIESLFVPLYLGFLLVVFVLLLYLYRTYSSVRQLEPQFFLLFTLLLITVFYILYYAPLPQLFVWFVAMAPFFLAIKEIPKAVRGRFQFNFLLFSLVMGMGVLVGKGIAVLFGSVSVPSSWENFFSLFGGEDPSHPGLTYFLLLRSMLNILRAIFFMYMVYLIGKGITSLLTDDAND
ncbi:MAG: hypothetical protein GWO20_01315 [Candidatus Korarchaeota archaeon]|nr:hypothetical protein [Candidatus Korarchaeota archaeon]NIU83084.1 hypothetical protein [Candidatus Thorarchaeota archaeon]NIW12628.1 hypothetical protein [Candidatus Thorarchaeota archaeon]NIW50839.1 hypothetical protein [Candidatus Korarchaeota archaeon]